MATSFVLRRGSTFGRVPSETQRWLAKTALVMNVAAVLIALVVLVTAPVPRQWWVVGLFAAAAIIGLSAVPLRLRERRFRVAATTVSVLWLVGGLVFVLGGGYLLLPAGWMLATAALIPAQWSLERALAAAVAAVALLVFSARILL